mgnify:CR=1 FL=1
MAAPKKGPEYWRSKGISPFDLEDESFILEEDKVYGQIDESLDATRLDLEHSRYNPEQIDRELSKRQKMLAKSTAPDSVSEWMEKSPDENTLNWAVRNWLIGAPGVVLGPEWVGATQQREDEGTAQWLLRFLSMGAGIVPLAQEAAVRMPVPEAVGPALALMYEQAKVLPTAEVPVNLGTAITPGAPAFAGVMNALDKQFGGVPDKKRVKWLEGLVEESVREGNWMTLGKLFLNAEPDERGFDSEGWWSQSMERLTLGEDMVHVMGEGAIRAGYKPKYSGLGHIKGALEGDPYSSAAMFGLVAELMIPYETAVVAPTKAATRGMSMAMRSLPLARGTTPEKLWKVMGNAFSAVRKSDVDAAAPEIARARAELAAGAEVVSKLPKEIRRNMQILAENIAPGARSVDALTELARQAATPIAQADYALKRKGKDLSFELKGDATPNIEGVLKSGADDIQIEDMKVVAPGKKTGDKDIDLVSAVTGATFNPDRVAEALYVSHTTGIGKAAQVTRAQEALAQLVGEAYRVAYRNRIGDDRLKNVAPSIWVTRGEADRITKTVDKDLKPFVKAMGRRSEDDAVKLTVDEHKYLNGLAGKYGVRPVIDAEGSMSRAAGRRFRDDIVAKRAGEGAKASYYIRKTPAMTSIGRSLLKLTPDRFANMVRSANENFVEWPLSFLVDLDRRRMSLPMRTELDKIYRKLTQNGNDMALTLRKKIAEAKKTGDFNPVALMKDLLEDQVDLVAKEQIDAVNAFRKATSDESVFKDYGIKSRGGAKPAQFLINFRKQFEDVVMPSLSSQERRLFQTTKDPAVIYQIAKGWSDKIDGRVDHHLKVLLETLYTPITSAAKLKARVKAGALGRAGSTSTELYGIQTAVQNKINNIEDNVAREMYEDFFYGLKVPDGGEWAVSKGMADSTSDALGLSKFMKLAYDKIGAPPVGYVGGQRSYLDWWWQYMMNLRAERYTSDSLRELIAKEYALDVNDPVFKAVDDIVTHPGDKKIEAILSGLGTAAESRAVQYLQRLGIDEYMLKAKGLIPAANRDMIQFMKSNTGMAPVIASEYRRMRDLGLMSARDMTGIKLLDNTRALMREGMTMGWWFMAKPAYFLGNLLSVPEQLMMTTGGRGLAGAGRIFTNPRIVGELVKRNAFGWKPRNSKLTLKTPHGVWGIDELEDSIRQYGVDRTYSRSENGRALMNDLLRERPGPVQWLVNTGGGLQEGLRTVNDSIEYTFRTAIYIDGLKRGDAPETAARVARESLYDYSTLTPAERKVARTVFTFYTFMRKNMDAFWKGFAEDPSRALRSLRFYQAQPSLWQMNREQFSEMNDQDMGRIALGEYENKKGRTGLYMSSPQSVFDAVLLSYDIANLTGVPSKLGGADRTSGESLNELSGQLASFLPTEPGWWLRWYAQHHDAPAAGSDAPATSRWSNIIPHFMMEGERGRMLRDWLPDIRWFPVESESSVVRARGDDDLPGFYALESKPRMLEKDQERIKEQIWWWQNFKTILGGGQPLRSAQKIADYLTANGILEGGEVELKEGTGNIMDILSAVQRDVPYSDENKLRRLEKMELGKESSERSAMDRVNP